MGRLTDTAREQISRNRSKAEVPEWFGRVALVVAAVLGLGMGFQILTNSGSTGTVAPPPTTLATTGTTGVGPTATTTPREPSAAPSGVVADDGATVTVLSDAGGTTAVPAAAVSLATLIARATVTGDWSGVPVPAGFIPPATPIPAAGAVVLDTQLVAGATTDSDITLRVRIDPSGSGTATPATKTVVVTRVNGGFSWAP
jgi:hypothetical protein